MELARNTADPTFGALSLDEVQICPQNCREQLTPDVLAELRELYPNVAFRLHANVRVLEKQLMLDLADYRTRPDYWAALISAHRHLQPRAYSLHAGKRSRASLNDIFCYVQELEDTLGIPVGIEGLYPTPNDHFLLSTWGEYARLLDAGVYFAVDLSHLNIVAHAERRFDMTLTHELLSSPYCMEIHVSDNDGIHDAHLPISTPPWWHSILNNIGQPSIIFFEGNLISSREPIVERHTT